MSDNTRETLSVAFHCAVVAANWITETDMAAVNYGRSIAEALDTFIENGELDQFTVLAPKYLAVLQQLHLTPETRTQGKQNDETTGSDYANAFIRLVTTEASKPASGGAKRRSPSKSTSGRPRAASPAVAKNSSR